MERGQLSVVLEPRIGRMIRIWTFRKSVVLCILFTPILAKATYRFLYYRGHAREHDIHRRNRALTTIKTILLAIAKKHCNFAADKR